jgi:hypothetical protein
VLPFGNQIEGSGPTVLVKFLEGRHMTDRISPQFHAEIILVLSDDYQDLRQVTDKVGILLSDASGGAHRSRS